MSPLGLGVGTEGGGHNQIAAPNGEAQERVIVASEDPEFWLSLLRAAPELGRRGLLVQSGRECLVAVEDPKVAMLVLDGALREQPARDLMHMILRVRPQVSILFASAKSDEAGEREARAAGVLYYGDRDLPDDLARVIRLGLTPAQHRRAPSRPPRSKRGES